MIIHFNFIIFAIEGIKDYIDSSKSTSLTTNIYFMSNHSDFAWHTLKVSEFSHMVCLSTGPVWSLGGGVQRDAETGNHHVKNNNNNKQALCVCVCFNVAAKEAEVFH